MKMKSFKFSVTLAVFIASLAACGGGGSDASGAPNDLSVTPAEIAFSYGGEATCAPIPAGTYPGQTTDFPGLTTVLINGGAGSYTITSTRPDEIVLGPVRRVSGVYQFTFQLIGSTCYSGEGAVIQVTDVRKNTAVVKVTSSASSP
jgi:hypothetical protein